MRASTIGIVSAAILLASAAAGPGIARAAVNPSDNPAWSMEDQMETGNLPEPDAAVPSAAGRGGSIGPYAEHRPVLSFEDEVQLMGPVETGAVPDGPGGSSSIVDTEDTMYRAGGDPGGP